MALRCRAAVQSLIARFFSGGVEGLQPGSGPCQDTDQQLEDLTVQSCRLQGFGVERLGTTSRASRCIGLWRWKPTLRKGDVRIFVHCFGH